MEILDFSLGFLLGVFASLYLASKLNPKITRVKDKIDGFCQHRKNKR